MKLSLIKQQGPCPPDGFRYVFPEDGFTVHAWTFNDWVALAKAHLQANGRTTPSELEALMEDQLCKVLPPGWCAYDDPGRPRPSTSLGWDDVIGGVKVFASWIAGGMNYVTADEANRRAEICSRCYLNVGVTGCSQCHKLAAEVTKDRYTKFDHALKACAACKCLLRAKVHFPISTLDKAATDQQLYPSFCWQKKESENYRG